MARKRQWHPVFAELLRPVVEGRYEVHTNVPVGDAPRQADILLLRRRRAGGPPLTGLWRDLTAWNVLEFKGPTVSPRDEDLDGLVEVGLGVHRRLNEERAKQGQAALGPEEVSLWYLADRLGRRLLAGWGRRLGAVEPHGEGVWRCGVLGRLVFLVSGAQLPVEEGSLPLHLVGRGPPQAEDALARLVAGRPELWERYGGWLAALHPQAYRGVLHMAKAKRERFGFDLEPLVQTMGLDWVLDKLGVDRVINQLGAKRVIEHLNPEQISEALTPRQRQQLKRLLEK